MNLMNEIDKIINEGYNEANAEARLCQDILLKQKGTSSNHKHRTVPFKFQNHYQEIKKSLSN